MHSHCEITRCHLRAPKNGFQILQPISSHRHTWCSMFAYPTYLFIITSALILVTLIIISDVVHIGGFDTIGQTFLTCCLPLSAIWASSQAVKQPNPAVRPSGSLDTMNSTDTDVRSLSKKSLFSFWSGGKGTQASVHTDVEKGSFTEESDHVMIQRTLRVVTTETPRSGSPMSHKI